MKSDSSEDLTSFLDPSRISTSEDDLERFSGDALGVYRAFWAASHLTARPRMVVRPTSTQEVSRVIQYANAKGIPVVPYGGGTGVMGGAVAVEGCIVLDLKNMNNILDISREDRAARVQAGVVLQDLEAALNKNGLILGHDPWSLPIATVGGAISTDGVGYRAAKYGSMGQQVLGLEVVLPNGEVLSTKDTPSPYAGLSLKHLFIGAEGTLGIITGATIRAFPTPEKRILRAIGFPDFESGFRAVSEMYSQGVAPSMVDYGEEPLSGKPEDGGSITLYLAFEGLPEVVEAQDRRAWAICQQYRAYDEGEKEARSFWETRHHTAERYKREVIDNPRPRTSRRRRSSFRMDYLHVCLPSSKVLEYRRQCQQILSGYPIAVREWSLWGGPEFFSFLIVEESPPDDGTSEAMAQAVDWVLKLAQDMGGSMEYCHGVGIKLAHLMERELGVGMSVLQGIKRSLDPNNILNPGKLGM